MDTAPWYYVDAHRQRQGPVPASDLAALLAAGTIGPRSLVWSTGMSEWQALETVAARLGLELTPPAAAPPPPMPPAATPPTASPRPSDALPGGATAPADASPQPADGAAGTPRAEAADAALSAAYAARVGVEPEAAHVATLGGPVVYARFLKRVAASLIDGFIVAIIVTVIQVPIALIGGVGLATASFDPSSGSILVQLISQAIGLAVGIAYFAYFYSSAAQATPGKQLVGTKVARPDGQRISVARAIGRYFANWLNVLTLLIGYLLPLFTEKRQALHDLVADTVVVDRWAFTEFPERQSDELGGCAIAVLVVWGVLILGGLGMMAIAIVALGAGGWK